MLASSFNKAFVGKMDFSSNPSIYGTDIDIDVITNLEVWSRH